MQPSASRINSKNSARSVATGNSSPHPKPSPKQACKSRQTVKLKHGHVESEPTDSPHPGRAPSKPAGMVKSDCTSTPSPKKTHQVSAADFNPNPKNPPLSAGSSVSLSQAGPVKKSKTGAPSNSSSQRQSRFQLAKKGECEICKQSCRSHCAGCKRVFYCCKQHQQQHWARHKLVCRPFSIPTQYSSSFHLRPPAASSSTSVNSSSSASTPAVAPELQFMISTKVINPGQVLFTEKPLLIVANVFSTGNDPAPDTALTWCASCLQPLSDANNNATPSTKKMLSCSGCEITLCCRCKSECNENSTSPQSKNLPGQGHVKEECRLIAGLRQKGNEYLRIGKGSCRNFMLDLAALRVLMFRTSCPWRWESLIALRNSPRYGYCCKHNFIGGGTLDEAHYPVAAHYIKNICKEKNVQLLDILRIITIFSEECSHNRRSSITEKLL